MDLADRISGPGQMEKIMSFVSKLTVALAATSLIAVAASTAHATVIIPKPVINIPKPAIHLPAINAKPIVNVAHPTPIVAPKPVANAFTNPYRIVKGYYDKNGQIHVSNNIGPIKPGTVPNHPAPSTPAPAASHPAPAKPAAAPPPAKPKITFTPVEYPAFTVNGAIKGYYVNGKLVMGLTGPSGSSCGIGTGFQIPGSSGISANYSSGAISIPVVKCMLRS
jgi:hypothetical protein